MPKAILFSADGSASEVDPSALRDYQALLGGPIALLADDDFYAFVAADAADRKLGFNYYATQLFGPQIGRDVIVLGPVLFLGKPRPDGTLADIDPALAGELLGLAADAARLRAAREKLHGDA